MNVRLKQLRDLVVALDRADRKLAPMTPEAYRAAAAKALTMTREQMGLLPMGDFAGPVNALQTLAENLFFGINGCFADLDGTGRAALALPVAGQLLVRLRGTSPDEAEEIAARLFARLRAARPDEAKPRPRRVRRRSES